MIFVTNIPNHKELRKKRKKKKKKGVPHGSTKAEWDELTENL